jgi:hypothetical protein
VSYFLGFTQVNGTSGAFRRSLVQRRLGIFEFSFGSGGREKHHYGHFQIVPIDGPCHANAKKFVANDGQGVGFKERRA